MARKAFKMRLLPGCEEIYKQKHDEIWPELAELIRSQGIRNYSIHREGLDLFAYYETDGTISPGVADGEIPEIQLKWWTMMADYMEHNDDSSPKTWPMEEMFYLA